MWYNSLMGRTKRLDAVVESRKWKETVAKETEGMTPQETLAYFDRATVHRRFQTALRRAARTSKGKKAKSR